MSMSEPFAAPPECDCEDRIRLRAYELWVLDGRPEGQHLDHWERAAREVRTHDFPKGSLCEMQAEDHHSSWRRRNRWLRSIAQASPGHGGNMSANKDAALAPSTRPQVKSTRGEIDHERQGSSTVHH